MINDPLNLSNQDVWKTRSSFNNEKWEASETKLKLLSVNWDSHYEHVVDWKTDSIRDKWFEDADGWEYEMTTGWNFKSLEVFKPGLGKHVGSIRVDVPYEAAINYNYIAVEMFEQPVSGGSKPRREVFYYFLTSLNKIAPNTTELYLELDTWTTYKNSVQFSGIKLNRGHYAHALTSADDYLSNPLENQLGLTEPEPDLPAVKPVVSSENFISFSKNTPRVCIATTADLTNLDSLWLNVKDAYHIEGAKDKSLPNKNWWEEVIYTADTQLLGSQGHAPIAAVGSPNVNGSTPSVRVYSLSTDDYSNFITLLRGKLPQLLKTIQAVFLLDSALISEGPAIEVFGFNLKPVIQQNSYELLETIGLSKDLFNYAPEYADFAKLYTSQFAVIEVSNLNGKTAEISIEEIAGSLQVYARSCAAFPFLKLEAFINGVGGSEKKSYAVKPWNNVNAELFKSQWEDFNFELDIPVYGVFAEAREVNGPAAQGRLVDAMQRNWNTVSNAEYNAYTNKDISSNSINTAYENATDSISKQFNNETDSISKNFSNANDSINLSFNNESDSIAKVYANSILMNNTDKDIADTNVLREYTNAQNTLTTEYYNAVMSINTTKENDTLSANTSKTIAIDSSNNNYMIADYNAEGRDQLYGVTQEIAKVSAQLNIWHMVEAAKVNIASGALNSISGSITSMNPIGAIGSSVSAGIDIFAKERMGTINGQLMIYQTNLANSRNPNDFRLDITGQGDYISYKGDSYNKAQLDFTNDLAMNEAYMNNVQETANATLSNETEITNINNSYNTSSAVALASKNLSNTVANQNKNTGNSINTTNYNARNEVTERDKTVSSNIASRIKSIGTGIANRDKTISSTIASRSKDVETEIAVRVMNTDRQNIQTNYDREITVAQANGRSNGYSMATSYYAAMLDAPTTYGSQDGNAWVDSWGQRGLDVRVRRCSKANEQMAGNTFYRFGYRNNGLWVEQPDLSLMSHFTYWEAEEIWLFGNYINETNKDIIRKTFKNGVTVWVNPEELCNIDITVNKPRSA